MKLISSLVSIFAKLVAYLMLMKLSWIMALLVSPNDMGFVVLETRLDKLFINYLWTHKAFKNHELWLLLSNSL
jgi:hypothetical protein